MAWDLRLDPQTRDLKPGLVTGVQEILQRLQTRLKRELGEWFLNTSAGLPWYQSGNGILGSKTAAKRTVDLLIRREVLGTEGVERIIRLYTEFPAGSRSYRIELEVFIKGAGIELLTLEENSDG